MRSGGRPCMSAKIAEHRGSRGSAPARYSVTVDTSISRAGFHQATDGLSHAASSELAGISSTQAYVMYQVLRSQRTTWLRLPNVVRSGLEALVSMVADDASTRLAGTSRYPRQIARKGTSRSVT